MKVTNIRRTFKAKIGTGTITLKDPNPALPPQEVMAFYSAQYPELTSANCNGPIVVNDKQEYVFNAILGTKG